ncbi:MAG: NrfD/PsrC family molybdoenzyme membrane anchor subunit [Myxococcaceae bacterium]
MPPSPLEPVPLQRGDVSDAALSRSLLAFQFSRPGRAWWALFGLACAGVGLFALCVALTLEYGIGMWGNNIPVAWAFGIINFVWWIGIGHAGTLISAILLLFQQRWRSSINRFAEAMTLFAVMNAGLFPLLHLGRPWLFYYLVPYPSTLHVWPQFRSALPWDMAAIATYFTVSLMFWYLGLLPDLATARDMAKPGLAQKLYALSALGWRGSARHWKNFRTGYLLLAGLATPLVLSVHSIVSFDFAISVLPGWHSTIFPPYFVAGAIFSGFAMVLTLMIPARAVLGFEHVITERHIDNMAKVLLATSLMVTYGYIQEHFFAWYSANPFEMAAYETRRTGPYAALFWIQIVCNCVVPQLMWSGRLRTTTWVVWLVSLAVNVGMWVERFNIIVVPLSQDFLPSSWGLYLPTWVDLGLFAGSLCFFAFWFLLFLKLVPPVAIHESKELRVQLEAAAAQRTGGAR